MEMRLPMTTAERLQTLAKDRSSSDVISAKVNPMARIERKLACFSTFRRLAAELKLSAKMSRNTKRANPASRVP